MSTAKAISPLLNLQHWQDHRAGLNTTGIIEELGYYIALHSQSLGLHLSHPQCGSQSQKVQEVAVWYALTEVQQLTRPTFAKPTSYSCLKTLPIKHKSYFCIACRSLFSQCGIDSFLLFVAVRGKIPTRPVVVNNYQGAVVCPSQWVKEDTALENLLGKVTQTWNLHFLKKCNGKEMIMDNYSFEKYMTFGVPFTFE